MLGHCFLHRAVLVPENRDEGSKTKTPGERLRPARAAAMQHEVWSIDLLGNEYLVDHVDDAVFRFQIGPANLGVTHVNDVPFLLDLQ